MILHGYVFYDPNSISVDISHNAIILSFSKKRQQAFAIVVHHHIHELGGTASFGAIHWSCVCVDLIFRSAKDPNALLS